MQVLYSTMMFFYCTVFILHFIAFTQTELPVPLSIVRQSFGLEVSFFPNHILIILLSLSSPDFQAFSFLMDCFQIPCLGFELKTFQTVPHTHTIKLQHWTHVISHTRVSCSLASGTHQSSHLLAIDLCIFHSFRLVWNCQSNKRNQGTQPGVKGSSEAASCLHCMVWAEERAQSPAAYVCLNRTLGRLFVFHFPRRYYSELLSGSICGKI